MGHTITRIILYQR